MGNTIKRHMEPELKDVDDCVVSIMAAEQLLSEIFTKACNSDEGYEGINFFLADGLCRSVRVAILSLGRSVDQMKQKMEDDYV